MQRYESISTDYPSLWIKMLAYDRARHPDYLPSTNQSPENSIDILAQKWIATCSRKKTHSSPCRTAVRSTPEGKREGARKQHGAEQ